MKFLSAALFVQLGSYNYPMIHLWLQLYEG